MTAYSVAFVVSLANATALCLAHYYYRLWLPLATTAPNCIAGPLMHTIANLYKLLDNIFL